MTDIDRTTRDYIFAQANQIAFEAHVDAALYERQLVWWQRVDLALRFGAALFTAAAFATTAMKCPGWVPYMNAAGGLVAVSIAALGVSSRMANLTATIVDLTNVKTDALLLKHHAATWSETEGKLEAMLRRHGEAQAKFVERGLSTSESEHDRVQKKFSEVYAAA